MSIIVQVPEVLLREIFGQWCRLTDLARFDMASHIQRKQLQQIISQNNLSVKGKHYKRDVHFAWCLFKGISIRNIVIHHVRRDVATDLSFLNNFPSYCVQVIDCEDAALQNFDPLINFINRCPNLISLTLPGAVADQDLSRIENKILQQLTTFKLQSFALTVQFSHKMAINCQKLTNLTLMPHDVAILLPILSIIERNPLQKFTLQYHGFKTIDSIFTALCCQYLTLTEITIDHCDYISFRTISGFLSTCIQLHNMKLSSNFRNKLSYSVDKSNINDYVVSLDLIGFRNNEYDAKKEDFVLLFQVNTKFTHIQFNEVPNLMSHRLFTVIKEFCTQIKFAVVSDCGLECT